MMAVPTPTRPAHEPFGLRHATLLIRAALPLFGLSARVAAEPFSGRGPRAKLSRAAVRWGPGGSGRRALYGRQDRRGSGRVVGYRERRRPGRGAGCRRALG